jgi:rSAM/selenodomain-associated transferase 2
MLVGDAGRAVVYDGGRVSPFVTVVIPVLRDAVALGRLIETMPDRDQARVVVVEADHAGEGLAGLREKWPSVDWRTAPQGRGVQLNAGAAGATTPVLLFLHADSLLPAGWTAEIRQALALPGIVGGCFRFALDSTAPAARVVERLVAWRVRWLGLPYGDQGLFIRRDTFERLGAFEPWPLMEDVELVQRLKRAGRLWCSSLPLVTSARRWEADGWVARSARNIALLILYACGVSPERLARRYERPRARPAAAGSSKTRTS